MVYIKLWMVLYKTLQLSLINHKYLNSYQRFIPPMLNHKPACHYPWFMTSNDMMFMSCCQGVFRLLRRSEISWRWLEACDDRQSHGDEPKTAVWYVYWKIVMGLSRNGRYLQLAILVVKKTEANYLVPYFQTNPYTVVITVCNGDRNG